MGMFDEIRCEAPLPDGRDAPDIYFQTKTFPFPCMQRYVITRAGRLIDSVGNDLEPDGYITFYTTEDEHSDTVAITRGRHQWREYRARFSAGRLQTIVRVEEENGSRVRYGLASYRWFDAPTFLFGDAAEGSETTPRESRDG